MWFLFSFYLFAFPLAVCCEDCKEMITTYLDQLENTPHVKHSEIKKRLAEAYLKDQNQTAAITTFLEAIETLVPVEDLEEMSPGEKKVFECAYSEYLSSPKSSSKKIVQEYAPVIQEHPHYYHLTYLISMAYANLGLFEPFFQTFYEACSHCPSFYLAEKTKAVLHIKLLERSFSPEQKKTEKRLIAHHLQKAIQKNAEDVMLYKMRIAFAEDQDKASVVEESLNKIVQENHQIPRHDIAFYIQAAIVQDKYSLAQRFIDKAKIWYPYSRAILQAEEQLKQGNKNGT